MKKATFILLLCIAVADVLWASPVTSYGSYSGAQSDQQARSADSVFAFKLPQAERTDQSSDLATQVTSLSSSGRSYGVGTLPANKDAIVYPDEIIRDSYGNIARPYVPLSPEKSHSDQGVGFLTNVNKDQTHHTPSAATEKLPWVLPSYAGGILQTNVPVATPELDLLPPLSSGNFNYPSVPSIPAVPHSDSKPNTVGTTKEDNYNNEVIHGQVNNNFVPTKGPGTLSGLPSTPTHSQPSKPQPNPSGSYNNNNLAQATTERSEYEKNYTHGKYHGGFGGAPGLLGDQKEIGYAVKNDKTHNGESNNVSPAQNSVSPSPQSTEQRPAVIDLSNNPTLIIPKPNSNAASGGQYGGSTYDPKPKPSSSQNPQNNPTSSGFDRPSHAGSINNGHIGPQSHSTIGNNVPSINLDLLAPESTNIPTGGSVSPINHVESGHQSQGGITPNYSYNSVNKGSPSTGTILGNPNQPEYDVVGSSAPSQTQSVSAPKPASYGGVAPTGGSNTPSYDSTPLKYPQNGATNQSPLSGSGSKPSSYGSSPSNYPKNIAANGSPTSGSIDSILGNQHQPGFAVVGSNAPANSNYGGAASTVVNGIQSTSHNQDLLDSILGNQKQPGIAFSGGPSHQAPVASPPKPSYGGSSVPAGVHHDTSYVNNKDKYTGGFGGPPGALTPHDNIAGTPSNAAHPVSTNSYSGPNRRY